MIFGLRRSKFKSFS